jgi:hypothetical protein
LCGKCARTNGAKPRNGNGHSQAGRFAATA